MTLTKAIEAAREAIVQVLDDGGYFNHNDEIYVAPDRQTGGGFCHAAGLQAIEALAALPEKPMTEEEIEEIIYQILFMNCKPSHGKLLTNIGYEILDALKAANVLYVEEK